MTNIKSKIKKLAERYSKEITDIRRKIHQNPELSFEEYETSKLVYEKLTKLKIDRVQRVSQTGVVGLIKNKNGNCVGLRADMDALPIHEKTGLPFASKNPGLMHACGHDAHTSMLYGAAMILNEIKSELNGSVKLIFQPAEEKNPGGASILIKQGILENPKVNAIFGQHVIADKPAGSLGFCEGVTFASQDELYITIYGRQSHGAKPHKSIDPIVIASQVILALQTIVSRNTSPYDPIVITVGAIHGGTATNIIPSEVKLMGTIRTLNEKLRKKSLKLIDRTIKGITQGAGAKYKFEISPGYPELNNNAKLTDFAKKAAVDFSGTKNIFKAERIMGAEDFAFYLKKTPGTFYRIGVGSTSDIHTPTINIDEKTLPVGAGFMAYLAVKYLNSNP
jgi:amidohydrolase